MPEKPVASATHSRLTKEEMEQAQELARRYSYPPTWDVAPINRSNWLLLARAVADLVEQIENLRDELDEFGEPRPGRLARAEDRIRDLEEQNERLTQNIIDCNERSRNLAEKVIGLEEQLEAAERRFAQQKEVCWAYMDKLAESREQLEAARDWYRDHRSEGFYDESMWGDPFAISPQLRSALTDSSPASEPTPLQRAYGGKVRAVSTDASEPKEGA